MDISESMVRFYLEDITNSYFNREDLPPDDVSGYRRYVFVMKQNALNHGDLGYLKLAFEHVLGNANRKWSHLGDERYAFDDYEVLEIIQYAWETIWPGEAPVPAD